MQRSSIATTVLLLVAMLVALGAPALAQERTFTSPLSGDEEVPPVDTDASGSAEYVLSADGTEMSFVVEVEALEDATMAHIHLGASGENGPPVVWLHTQEQAPELVPGVTTGTLASGSFTADDLVGPLEGGTLADLIDEMAAGNTYTNVHTEEHEAGEIRGQIAEVDDDTERPERVDAGAGGTADATGGGLLVLLVGFVVLAGAAVLVVRRRVTAA